MGSRWLEIRVRKCRQVEERAKTEEMVGREWKIWRRSSVARSVRCIMLLRAGVCKGSIFEIEGFFFLFFFFSSFAFCLLLLYLTV